jgi:hypothetical protein
MTRLKSFQASGKVYKCMQLDVLLSDKGKKIETVIDLQVDDEVRAEIGHLVLLALTQCAPRLSLTAFLGAGFTNHLAAHITPSLHLPRWRARMT